MKNLSDDICNILYWNVWSIQNEKKLDNLLQIIEDLDIQIACICETWFDSLEGTFTKRIEEEGFLIAHAFREEKKGGGAAIIYKKSLKVKPGEVSSSKYISFEFSTVILKYSQAKILLMCIYRKQEQSFKNFREEFESFLDGVGNKAEMLIIVGDFNVWVDVKNNKNAKNLMTLMNAFGLDQLVNVPTHNAGHTLDHVYVNMKQLNITIEVLEDKLDISTDHNPIMLKLPPLSKVGYEFISFRKIKEINIPRFKEEFEGIIERLDCSNNDFASNIKTLLRSSHELIDKHAPVITKKLKLNRKPPWVDEEFMRSRSKRRKLEKCWKKNKNDETRNSYIEQRNICAEMSKKKQREYYTDLLNNTNKDQKSLFKISKTLLGKKKQRVLPNHSNAIDLENEFNNYYIDKIDKIRETIPVIDERDNYIQTNFDGIKLEDLKPTTVDELKDIIQEYGIKTSQKTQFQPNC